MRALAVAALVCAGGCAWQSTTRVTPWFRYTRARWVPDWGDSTRDGLPPDRVERRGVRGWEPVANAAAAGVALDGDRHVLFFGDQGAAVIDRAGAVRVLGCGCPRVAPDRRSIVCARVEDGAMVMVHFGDDGAPRDERRAPLAPAPPGLDHAAPWFPALIGFFPDGEPAFADAHTGADWLGPVACRLFALRGAALVEVAAATAPAGGVVHCDRLSLYPAARLAPGFSP